MRTERGSSICICVTYEILYAALWETASEESQTIYPIERKDVLTANFKQGKPSYTLVASSGGCLQLSYTLGFHHAFKGNLSLGLSVGEKGDQKQFV